MTYHEGRRHTDIHLLSSPLLLYHLLGLLGNRLQTVDEEFRDAGYQFHHGTHGHTEEQHFLDIHLGHSTNQGTHDDTQHDRLTEYTELLFQAIGIDIKFREAGNPVEQPVDADGKGRKALAERLGNRDTVHIVVVALELLGRQVGHHQGDDIADDGSEIAPSQALIHHEVSHGSDKGEVPVVPQVDIHCARAFCDKQQEVHTQTDGDDQCAHRRVIGHCRSSRPTHVEHAELQVVQA